MTKREHNKRWTCKKCGTKGTVSRKRSSMKGDKMDMSYRCSKCRRTWIEKR